ncbi:ComF family protein [Flavobacteriaceae bacterium MAR_2010_72]|nr:ComF family protein [Flavobacteriaceae bacterium MAR_2010_72]
MVINLLNLFFPRVCLGCSTHLGDNETYLCGLCRHNLPVTNFHFDQNDTVKNALYGRIKLEQATALLHFSKKGIVQQLMHNLKYRGHEEVGEFLGKWLGEELKSLTAYKAIDVVIPVPLHRSKLRQRGYNQVTKFGQEIAKALEVDFNDLVLQKTLATKTQVFKDRLLRTSGDAATFSISENQSLKGKHILLVDDIITTGATIESCANALFRIEGVKISVATMAITD